MPGRQKTFKGRGDSSKNPHMANVPRSARQLTLQSPVPGRRRLCSSWANREAAEKLNDAFVKAQPSAELPERANHDWEMRPEKRGQSRSQEFKPCPQLTVWP